MPKQTAPISFFLERMFRRMEKRYDYSFDYMRHMWHVSRPAFRRFSFGFIWFARGRDTLPAAPAAVAAIVSTMKADCGPCTQISVNMALEQGVGEDILAATVAGDLAALPRDLALVYRFAEAVVNGDFDATDMREGFLELYGEGGLVDLSTAIAVGQVYPVLKRTLGFGETCLKVKVGNADIAASKSEVQAA
jgi:alkylhydroperoxidase/carboxymuconolactone decarboxylase family protein YurZ